MSAEPTTKWYEDPSTPGILVSIDYLWEHLPELPPMRNEELAEVRQALIETLDAAEGIRKHQFDVPPPPSEERLRVRPGVYVGVGDAARAAFGIGSFALAIVFHPAFVVVLAKGPRAVKKLLRFDGQLRPKLITLWSNLQGDERLVFETVHKKQIETVITNYDSYAQKDFRKAYGQRPPTEDDVIGALKGHLDAQRVLSVLADLVSKGILSRSEGSYSIRI